MYTSLEQICREEKEKGTPFWKLVQQDDCQELMKTEEESMDEMRVIYEAMRQSNENYEDSLKSASGLVGG